MPVRLDEIERIPGDARAEQELERYRRLVALAEWLEHRPEQTATQSETVDAMAQSWGTGEASTRQWLHRHVQRTDISPYASDVTGPRGRYRVARRTKERGVDYLLKEGPK